MRKIFMLPLLLNVACVPVVMAGAATTAVGVEQERTVGDAVDDVAIKTNLMGRYADRHFEDYFYNIDTSVSEGRVLLSGKVTTHEVAMEAVKIAWEVPNVREVINELQITNTSSVKDYSRDVYIKGRLKSQFLLDKDIRSVNYTVEVVGRTVYIFGVARNKAEMDKVLRIARNTPYVEKVVNHTRLSSDPLRNRSSAAQ